MLEPECFFTIKFTVLMKLKLPEKNEDEQQLKVFSLESAVS